MTQSLVGRLSYNGMDITTAHVYPPIPIRTSDWCAYLDGEEECGPYGWGSTEDEAVADLIQQLEEDEI